MKLVKEDINFERGQNPKRAMDIGMSAETKLDSLVGKLNEFISLSDSPFKWMESKMASYDYEIYQYDKRKMRIIYGTYTKKTGLFDINDIVTSSIDESIQIILKYLYPNLEEDIKRLDKIKTYLESKSIK